MNRDEMERLGPDAVRLLHQTGYFRDLDGRAATQRYERKLRAHRIMQQRKKKR